ncbi:hypothetical protein PFISCL1PPCAC_27886, partial [Pristionchus fissidentatus]
CRYRRFKLLQQCKMLKKDDDKNESKKAVKQSLVCPLCESVETFTTVSAFSKHVKHEHNSTCKESRISFRCKCGVVTNGGSHANNGVRLFFLKIHCVKAG